MLCPRRAHAPQVEREGLQGSPWAKLRLQGQAVPLCNVLPSQSPVALPVAVLSSPPLLQLAASATPRWTLSLPYTPTATASQVHPMHCPASSSGCRIVSLVDIFEIDNNTFATVLELVQGGDLDAYCKLHEVGRGRGDIRWREGMAQAWGNTASRSVERGRDEHDLWRFVPGTVKATVAPEETSPSALVPRHNLSKNHHSNPHLFCFKPTLSHRRCRRKRPRPLWPRSWRAWSTSTPSPAPSSTTTSSPQTSCLTATASARSR